MLVITCKDMESITLCQKITLMCYFFLFSRLGSQFFITLGDNLDFLDKEHCVFGEVVEGFDALLNINEAICDEQHIPYQDIRYE